MDNKTSRTTNVQSCEDQAVQLSEYLRRSSTIQVALREIAEAFVLGSYIGRGVRKSSSIDREGPASEEFFIALLDKATE